MTSRLVAIAKSIEPKGGYFGYYDFVDALEANPPSMRQFKAALAKAKPEDLDDVADADPKYGWIVMGAADALDLLPDDPRNFMTTEQAAAIPDNKVLKALCSACILNDKATVQQLAARVDVNALDHNKQCALAYAVGNNHVDCVQILLEHGANPSLVQNWGNTPMHCCASSASSKKIFRMLRKAGGSIDGKNDNGETVTDLLKQFGREDWLK